MLKYFIVRVEKNVAEMYEEKELITKFHFQPEEISEMKVNESKKIVGFLEGNLANIRMTAPVVRIS